MLLGPISPQTNRNIKSHNKGLRKSFYVSFIFFQTTGRNVFQGIPKDKDITSGQVVDGASEYTAVKVAHLDETDNTFKSQTISENGNYGYNSQPTVRNLQMCDYPILKGAVAYPLSSSHPHCKGDTNSDADNVTISNGSVNTLEKAGDRTPEISEVIKEMEKVSPFQQLADNSPAISMEMTPDVCQITQAMKDVSPFQELVNDDKMELNSPQVTSEDPCDSQVVPESLLESLLSEEMPFVRYSHESNSRVHSQNDKYLKSGCDKKSIIHTKSCKDSDNMLMNSYLTKPISESDFELLTSEEFGPTFEVVSDFVDEMESFRSSFSTTDLFKNFKDTPGNIEKPPNVQLFDKDENNQNRESNGNVSECQKEESFMPRECDYSKEKANNDVVEAGESGVKSEEKKTKDLDDWFNDVLMEVGEWLS